MLESHNMKLEIGWGTKVKKKKDEFDISMGVLED